MTACAPTSRWPPGVEGRVPFLDKEFMDVAMRLQPADKMCGKGKIEKHILREAFEDLLPHEVAWRQKEQFSDGVGYSWIDSLKAMVEEEVTDQMFEAAAFRFPVNPRSPRRPTSTVPSLTSTSAGVRCPHRALRQVGRLLHPDRAGMGCQVQRDGRPVRSRRDGRPPAGLLIR